MRTKLGLCATEEKSDLKVSLTDYEDLLQNLKVSNKLSFMKFPTKLV
jgi:hypothetical protein